MTKYTITAPEPQFNGEFAGLVFRAGEARAETPADMAAVTYCQRRGYTVDAVDSDGDPLPEGEQPGAGTHDPDVMVDMIDDNEADATEGERLPRPADYAAKADWVAYAVQGGAAEADANAATKNDLIQLYG